MNILVFTHKVSGHNTEYIHHVYQMARYDKGNSYVFLLPSSFINTKKRFEWAPSDNIVFDLFDELCDQKKEIPIYESFRWSKFVAKYVDKYKIDYVYINTMILFVPFAPLFIRKPTKIVGIIYRIYLHDIDSRSNFSYFLDKLKFRIMAYFRVFHRVLILNDARSTVMLNKIYKTDKFTLIPDPYVPIKKDLSIDIRQEYNISHDKILFIHFGSMNGTKATIEILKSILVLPEEEREKYAFFFAGKVSSGIRDNFYELFAKAKNKVQILLKDEFCSYEFLASLCMACDAILTPYRRTAQSSGLIGYASQFGKPVVAVRKGLLGELVEEYGLGVLINDTDTASLLSGYRQIATKEFNIPTKKYCEQNSIESFQKVIQTSFT